MYYHVITCGESGMAYAVQVKSVKPSIFSKYSLFAGKPCFETEYFDGSIYFEPDYTMVNNPEIISHLAGHFYKVQLTQEQVNNLPHKVKGK